MDQTATGQDAAMLHRQQLLPWLLGGHAAITMCI